MNKRKKTIVFDNKVSDANPDKNELSNRIKNKKMPESVRTEI